MDENLTEFMDAEIFVTGADAPAGEEKLLEALKGVPGIAEVKISGGRVDIHYDPIAVTKKELGQTIEAAGFPVKEIDVAASSPITDLELPG